MKIGACWTALLAIACGAAQQAKQELRIEVRIENDNAGTVRVYLGYEGGGEPRRLATVAGRSETVWITAQAPLKDRYFAVEIDGEPKGRVWRSEDLFSVGPGDCLVLRIGNRAEYAAVWPCD
jgi:hypothetical protein